MYIPKKNVHTTWHKNMVLPIPKNIHNTNLYANIYLISNLKKYVCTTLNKDIILLFTQTLNLTDNNSSVPKC